MIRLKEVVYSLEDIKKKVLNLGYCGDKGVLEIKFDCSEFFKDKDTKNAKLLLIKPDDTNSAIDLTVADDMASLSVDDGITDVVGFGEYQLKLDDGTNVFHSPKGRYRVGAVINDPVHTGLTGRTFLLNESINVTYEMFAVTNVISFDVQSPIFQPLFKCYVEGNEIVCGLLEALQMQYPSVLYVTMEDNPFTPYINTWQHEGYRTITFVSEPTGGDHQEIHFANTEETLAWLAENAVEVTE